VRVLDTLEVKSLDAKSLVIEDLIYNIQVSPEANLLMSEFVYFIDSVVLLTKLNKIYVHFENAMT
jgi:hypothetical protein